MKHGPQIHVHGIIGPYGAGPLRVVKGTFNSENYQKAILTEPPIKHIIEAMIFLNSDAIFQQDKAPCRWSLSTRNFLSNKNVPLLPWPGNSPDCSPIENVWHYIGQKVKDFNVTNSVDLFRIVQEIWYDLLPKYLLNLYNSMPKSEVIKHLFLIFWAGIRAYT